MIWQILDAIESRNKVLENDMHETPFSNNGDVEVISVSVPYFQAAECRPVDYPNSEVIEDYKDGNKVSKIVGMIHPSFQGMDYVQALTNQTNIFIGLDMQSH